MSQPYTDWEVVEEKTYPYFRYMIIKVILANASVEYRGVVVTKPGTNWQIEHKLEHTELHVLRILLLTIGQQNS